MILFWTTLGRAVLLFFIASDLSQAAPYYGVPLGTFFSVSNKVKGNVFAVDADTLFIKDFSYDGHSEDTVFWAGSSEQPDVHGFALENKTAEFKAVHPYSYNDVTLELPKEKSLKDVRWLSLWNRNSSKSLGTLIFLKPIQPPEPISIGPLIHTSNGVSTGDILIIDTQTFMIRDFNYDGSQKETYWWLSIGKEPDERGIPLLENGRDAPLEETINKTIEITLPKGNFVADYETLSVWNRLDGNNYGFVYIPKNLNVPPSSRILGMQEPEMTDFNCETLNDKLGLQVRWIITGYDIIFHLIGNIGPNEYMALGLSKDDTETRLESTDAMVAGLDSDGKAFITDYFFQSNQKCENGRGMCPDAIYGSDDNLELLHAETYENSTVIVFKRHLRAEDTIYDQNIYTDGPQAILWAVGSLQPEGIINTPTTLNQRNFLLDFGRGPSWNCHALRQPKTPIISLEEKIHHIHCPAERSFRAQLGSYSPSNEKKVWYINGIPTPSLTVQRGNTYTFIIEGGLNPPHHHPFYITSSKEGGLYKNILETNQTSEVTFAGIKEDKATGNVFPIAEGRLCDWSYSDMEPKHFSLTSHQTTIPTLALYCEPGETGKLIWTPTIDTPNEVYYQSFTERNLGGKIDVVDFCEETISHRYLETRTKGGKPQPYPTTIRKGELEKESEIDEYDLYLSTEDEMNVEETRVKHEQEKSIDDSNSTPIVYVNYSPNPDKKIISNNFINYSDNHNERMDSAGDKELSESTNSPESQETKNPLESFPHDESERSDIYSHHSDISKPTNYNAATLISHRNTENEPIKYVPDKHPPQEFKPHFEGGFVPLVMNPMKEKEFSETRQIIYPVQSHRPFFYNESIPFHGTFKPGVPDFSGFNISNYSQDDASIIIVPNQDNLPFLSASNPQPVHKQFTPFGAISLHLLQRHNEPPPRHQRPQDFNYRFPQQPPLVGMRKNVIPLPSIKNNKPNIPIPNVRDEDLAGISSQTVYVAMQAAGDKNANFPSIPKFAPLSTNNRNQQKPTPNKMILPHSVHRRPDFNDEKRLGNQPSVSHRNFNTPHYSPVNNNKHNQQNLRIPISKSNGLQMPPNIQPHISNSKVHDKKLQGEVIPARIPQELLRHPYPSMQAPPRERIHQVPLINQGMRIRRPNPQDEKLKMVEEIASPPQNGGNRLPFLFHMLNKNEKVSQESKEPQLLDPLSSKEQRYFPQLTNAQLVELLNKNNAQIFTKEKPNVNPVLLMQRVPVNESLNIFSGNTNMKFDQNVHIIDYQKYIPFGNLANFTILPREPEKSVNIFVKEETISPESKNIPLESNNPEVDEKKSNNDRNPIVKEELEELYPDESHKKLENRHIGFRQHEAEKSLFETSIQADLPSPNPTKVQLPTVPDYVTEVDGSDKSDSVIYHLDYSSFNVPFGARLKFPQNGTRIPIRNLNEGPIWISGIPRKPVVNVRNTQNPNPFIKVKISESRSTSSTTTTEVPLVAVESISHSNYDNNQTISTKQVDYIKKLYHPPLPPLPEIPGVTNLQTNWPQPPVSSGEMIHIPIIADALDGIVETHASFLGRKNILPSNSNPALPVFVVPPKVSEDINLPQISETLPTKDNKTDYSILNHILTLIGGPPESKAVEPPS